MSIDCKPRKHALCLLFLTQENIFLVQREKHKDRTACEN